MGWEVTLREPCGHVAEVQRHTEGGTYVLGGTDKAELYVTYNYSPIFRRVLPHGFKEDLHGKKAKDVIELLSDAIEHLKDDVHEDYWKPTEGNARRALLILHAWATAHPEATFEVF